MRVALLFLTACGGGEGPPCSWCADAAPFVRPCRQVMVASGDQPVCIDDGESRLCEPPSNCGPKP